ncbi:TPA: hypothetical protein L4X21_002950 [Pseudomonas aeruginosa]|nr:hypothetical protein [Pseudomonas aeruginosa]
MTTAKQRLDEVRAAISDVLLKGQRLKRGEREVYKAELASLRMLEQQYAAAAAQEEAAQHGRGRNRVYYLKI